MFESCNIEQDFTKKLDIRFERKLGEKKFCERYGAYHDTPGLGVFEGNSVARESSSFQSFALRFWKLL